LVYSIGWIPTLDSIPGSLAISICSCTDQSRPESRSRSLVKTRHPTISEISDQTIKPLPTFSRLYLSVNRSKTAMVKRCFSGWRVPLPDELLEVGDTNSISTRTRTRSLFFGTCTISRYPKIISKAIAAYQQSVKVYESIRADLRSLPKESQTAYVKSISKIYQALADLLNRQRCKAEAQQVLDLLKVQ